MTHVSLKEAEQRWIGLSTTLLSGIAYQTHTSGGKHARRLSFWFDHLGQKCPHCTWRHPLIMDIELLTVEQVADRTGLSAHTLRYYERIGLLDPVGRATSGHRRYAARDLACSRITIRHPPSPFLFTRAMPRQIRALLVRSVRQPCAFNCAMNAPRERGKRSSRSSTQHTYACQRSAERHQARGSGSQQASRNLCRGSFAEEDASLSLWRGDGSLPAWYSALRRSATSSRSCPETACSWRSCV